MPCQVHYNAIMLRHRAKRRRMEQAHKENRAKRRVLQALEDLRDEYRRAEAKNTRLRLVE